jgi:hypothetical protein
MTTNLKAKHETSFNVKLLKNIEKKVKPNMKVDNVTFLIIPKQLDVQLH